MDRVELPGSRPGALYTLGTGNRSIEDFLDILASRGIGTVVDVRSSPFGRVPHFRRIALQESLAGRGIRYLYLGDRLGGFVAGGFDAYRMTLRYAAALRELAAIAAAGPSVIICAERDPSKCHRSAIGEDMEKTGCPVIHIP